MEENRNEGSGNNNQDVRREDLNQKNEGGRDVTRTGSTGSDINAGEWKLGDEESQRTSNPEVGSSGNSENNMDNGGNG